MLRDASSGNGFQIAASGDDKRTVSRGGKTYKQDRSGINADRLRKVPERVHEDAPGSLPAPAPTPQLQPTAASAEDDDGMLSLEETVELLRRQNAKLQALVGGESDTAALIDELNDEIAGLKGENHTLETQRDAFMNESAQLKREIKAVGRENVTLRESVSGVPEHLTRRHRQGPRERLEH